MFLPMEPLFISPWLINRGVPVQYGDSEGNSPVLIESVYLIQNHRLGGGAKLESSYGEFVQNGGYKQLPPPDMCQYCQDFDKKVVPKMRNIMTPTAARGNHARICQCELGLSCGRHHGSNRLGLQAKYIGEEPRTNWAQGRHRTGPRPLAFLGLACSGHIACAAARPALCRQPRSNFQFWWEAKREAKR